MNKQLTALFFSSIFSTALINPIFAAENNVPSTPKIEAPAKTNISPRASDSVGGYVIAAKANNQGGEYDIILTPNPDGSGQRTFLYWSASSGYVAKDMFEIAKTAQVLRLPVASVIAPSSYQAQFAYSLELESY